MPGVPGVGEVTAGALIRHFGSVEAMLARPGEIPGAVTRGGEKLKEKILAHADRLRLNRKLVTLKTDMALPWDPEGLARRPVDAARAKALFTELEFTRLLREVEGLAAAPAAGARRGRRRRGRARSRARRPGAARSPARARARRRRSWRPPGRGRSRRSCSSTRPPSTAAARHLAGCQAIGLLAVGRGGGAAHRPGGRAGAGRRRAGLLPAARPPLPGGAGGAAGRGGAAGAARRSSAGQAPVHAHERKGTMHALARLDLR